ncbi:uncharacterized protein LOC144128233 isoform X2 [Amblyomma americanum]
MEVTDEESISVSSCSTASEQLNYKTEAKQAFVIQPGLITAKPQPIFLSSYQQQQCIVVVMESAKEKQQRQNEARKRRRAQETPEERAARLEKRRKEDAARRSRATSRSDSSTAEEIGLSYRERRNERLRRRRAEETEEERARRREKRRLRDAAKRARLHSAAAEEEPPSPASLREARLARRNDTRRRQRAEETAEERAARLEKRRKRPLAGLILEPGGVESRRRADFAQAVSEHGHRSFANNPSGSACSVRDQLWRRNDLAPAKCAAAGRTSSQPTDDSREHGQGFLTESKAGAVVGTCAACGSFITFPPVPGVGTQTEAKHEGTQTRALVCARGTQTST